MRGGCAGGAQRLISRVGSGTGILWQGRDWTTNFESKDVLRRLDLARDFEG
jgi:hypothetical protein